jgi:Transcriptional Coactivator p15 (PC4)
MDKEEGEVCRMQINPTDYLLFSIKEYKGKRYVDLRKYVVSDSYTGFTKQGIRFISDLFPEFEENLSSVKKALPKEE